MTLTRKDRMQTSEKDVSKYVPMLCENATRPVDYYIENDDWWAEQKLDGHRVLISIWNGEPTPYNRNGERFRQSIPQSILAEFRNPAFAGEWIFDGELIGGEYYVFDTRMASNLGAPIDMRVYSYDSRRAFLDGLFARWVTFRVHLLPCVTTSLGKRDLYEKIKANDGEGVIFKHREGLYYPGKRSHHMLKHKFVETGDVIVTEVWREGKRSVGIAAYDNGVLTDIGACTMTERNLERVRVGSVIEVKYLYRGAGGNLFQPRFVRLRDDKLPMQCTIDQFKNVNKEIIT